MTHSKMTNTSTQEHQDFLQCQESIQRNSRSFYLSFKSLPYKKRKAVFAIYNFFRLVDDEVDENIFLIPNKSIIDLWEDFKTGKIVDHYLFRSLEWTFNEFDLQFIHFDELISGIKSDLDLVQLQTEQDLDRYCYLVAGTVGLVLLPILAEEKYLNDELKTVVSNLGKSMQITNILRDVGEDLDRNRCYLPKEMCDEFGLNMQTLKSKQISKPFLALSQSLYSQARPFYQDCLKHLSCFDQASQKSLCDAIFLYRGILDLLHKKKFASLQQRLVLSKSAVLFLVLRSEIYRKLHLLKEKKWH